jgi:hypothetical protein
MQISRAAHKQDDVLSGAAAIIYSSEYLNFYETIIEFIAGVLWQKLGLLKTFNFFTIYSFCKKKTLQLQRYQV